MATSLKGMKRGVLKAELFLALDLNDLGIMNGNFIRSVTHASKRLKNSLFRRKASYERSR